MDGHLHRRHPSSEKPVDDPRRGGPLANVLSRPHHQTATCCKLSVAYLAIRGQGVLFGCLSPELRADDRCHRDARLLAQITQRAAIDGMSVVWNHTFTSNRSLMLMSASARRGDRHDAVDGHVMPRLMSKPSRR